MKQVLLLIFLFPLLISAQTESIKDSDIVNVSVKNGLEDSDLQTLFDFENINHSQFFFNGESIEGKHFVLKIKEF
ncbi:hypothetical protein LB467_01905 [Salegentibacter sp. JZCK2]|uniref:hypothetical protein n=1 Tax=Salegentibacter tibetensis TaxID=2873600 RepID=UPI001CD00AB5|nr:hypothetical protein [Salegentibacter tibetensis]MBZ9728428.1 hypothetical protein [Salegentibacter tibetensis]